VTDQSQNPPYPSSPAPPSGDGDDENYPRTAVWARPTATPPKAVEERPADAAGTVGAPVEATGTDAPADAPAEASARLAAFPERSAPPMAPGGPPPGNPFDDAALSGRTVAFRRDGPLTQPPPARSAAGTPAPPAAPLGAPMAAPMAPPMAAPGRPVAPAPPMGAPGPQGAPSYAPPPASGPIGYPGAPFGAPGYPATGPIEQPATSYPGGSPFAPATAPGGGKLFALAGTAAVALVISCILGLSRFVATWLATANGGTPGGAATWAYSAGPIIAQLLFALIAGGAAVAAVLSKEGRRPLYVALLAVTALVCGMALNDTSYLIVTSINLR
jgi:hypothetical protein